MKKLKQKDTAKFNVGDVVHCEYYRKDINSVLVKFNGKTGQWLIETTWTEASLTEVSPSVIRLVGKKVDKDTVVVKRATLRRLARELERLAFPPGMPLTGKIIYGIAKQLDKLAEVGK